MSFRTYLALALLALALLAILLPAPVAAQDDGPTLAPGAYVGPGTCANGACHGAPEPRAGDSILGNEYTSRVLDPHFRAYDVLGSELAAAMAEALSPGSSAFELESCLACHAVQVAAGVPSSGIYADDGISCEGCHGPAGGWLARHHDEGWSHADSVAAGMNDLRRPAVRAEVCFGCHLGDESRKVDHRLIAAGHPRLTFELDNFSEVDDPENQQLLRHWRPSRVAAGHGVRAWAAGQATAFASSLRRLADDAEGDGPWPEFAALDCAGCHHPVGDGSWRQRAGYSFRGGLPQWSPAPWAVLRHLVAEFDGDLASELDTEVEKLANRVASLRHPDKVAGQARALADRLADLAPRLEGLRFDRGRTRDLVDRLTTDGERLLAADLASAEQVAWALQSLEAHQRRLTGRRGSQEQTAALDRLFAELADPMAFDAERFVAQLKALGGL